MDPHLVPAELLQLLGWRERRRGEAERQRGRARESDVKVAREGGAEVKSRMGGAGLTDGEMMEEKQRKGGRAAAGREDKGRNSVLVNGQLVGSSSH